MKSDNIPSEGHLSSGAVRLNRFLASCGLGSRRGVERFVREGRVYVNGSMVCSPAARVAPATDRVVVDGKEVRPSKMVSIVVNKPPGCVCSLRDRFNPTVFGGLPVKFHDMGLFPVGRLDRETEGLLILTNDGDLAQKIMHPGGGVTKTYEIYTKGSVADAAVIKLKEGAVLDGKPIKPVDAVLVDSTPKGSRISVTVSEGLKREVRRLADAAGIQVTRLVRKRIGLLQLEKLPRGAFSEVQAEKLLQMIRSGGKI